MSTLQERLHELRDRFSMAAQDHEGGAIPLGLAEKFVGVLDANARVLGLEQSPHDADTANIVVRTQGVILSVSADLLIAAKGYAQARSNTQVEQVARLIDTATAHINSPMPHLGKPGSFR